MPDLHAERVDGLLDRVGDETLMGEITQHALIRMLSFLISP